MKTPIKNESKIFGADVENLQFQFSQYQRRNEDKTGELKKNMLLTPFLLAIPVIIILFILISGSGNEVPAISTEPIQHELVNTERSEKINVAVMKADSSINLKGIGLPARK
jgi:heme/copper-type cytochrome/quinol oxidase subunit 2